MNDGNRPNIISGIKFATHILAFVRQCVKGIIISSYRFASDEGSFSNTTRDDVLMILQNKNFLLENLINYLNQSWHSYHQNKDPYVIEKITLIKDVHWFEHNFCLFNFLFELSHKILSWVSSRIELSHLKDKEFLGECLDIIIDAISTMQVDDLKSGEMIKCTDPCQFREYKWDEDLIFVKELKIPK